MPMTDTTPAQPILAVRDLTVRFGGIVALDSVSFAMREGQIVGLIGPNGAGKTTLFNCLSRLYTPDQGDVLFEGRSLLAAAPHHIAEFGIGRTFQNLALFSHMSVLDNIMVGRHHLMRNNFVTGMLYWVGGAQREEQEHRRKVEDIIDFLEIQHVRNEPAGTLPYGLRKRVELARAIAIEPELILLDEPMAGMNLEEKEDMARYVVDLNQELGKTVIMIEHDMGVVMDISHRVMVLDFGRKICEGSPEEVLANEHVKRAYLGVDDVPLHEQDVELVAP